MIPLPGRRDVLEAPFALSPSEKMSKVTQTLERINKVLETLSPKECCICDASQGERQAQVTALQGFQQEITRTENALKGLAQEFPSEATSAATTTLLTKNRITVLLQKHEQVK